jgi:RES domain/HEPN/RES N-terminal domain 1
MARANPLCPNCISDKVLSAWVEEHGQEATCAYCGTDGTCCSLESVAEEIDRVLRQFYTVAPEEGHVADWTDNIVYYADGESAEEILASEVIDAEGAVADIIEILSENESRDVRDGDDAFYGDVPLRHIRAYPDKLLAIWDEFEHRLKHEVRFFDEEGRRMLDVLFGDLPRLGGGRAVVTLDPQSPDSKVYRARIVAEESAAEEFIRDPARHIGPPPPESARPGRMNPAGIPAFYGAFSKEVALAEIRPPVGSLVAIGEFSLLKQVRLLDMSFLPFAYHEESMFSPSYEEARSKVKFLQVFHHRISRPVLPSDEALAYLPTQAVAAYVTNVLGLDGIIYSSTQVGAEGESTGEQLPRNLCNVVLFGPAALVERTPPPPRPPEPEPFDEPILPAFGFLGLGADRPRDVVPVDANPTPAVAAPVAAVDAQKPEEAGLDNGGVATKPASTAAATKESVITPPDGLSEDGRQATLRVTRDPELVRVRAVKVETSGTFAHLYDDGRVLIDEHDDDDDYD